MNNLMKEELVPFAKAGRALKVRPHISTLHRWRLRGINGIRLETVLIGGRRYTSAEALERFAARTTAAAEGQSLPARTPKQRKQAIEQAERELGVTSEDGEHATSASKPLHGSSRGPPPRLNVTPLDSGEKFDFEEHYGTKENKLDVC